MAAKKASRKSDGSVDEPSPARAPSILMRLSGKHVEALRKAKDAASGRFLKPAPSVALSAFATFAASPGPAPAMNLVGVGIGEQISDGKHTGIMAVKFLVRIKYPYNQIPEADRLPHQVDGYPVDVEQVGTFRRFASTAVVGAATVPNPRTMVRPAQPGCSIGFQDPGHRFVMAGTFGALVGRGKRRFILSNNHVLADENKLPLRSPIFQPGFLDAGNPPKNGAIATLTKFVTLAPGGAANRVDAAIAELDSTNLATNSILFIGPPNGKTSPQIDMVVHKFGRTTGFTVGRATSVETDVNVQYEAGTMMFDNQIIVVGLNASAFSASGDSGSLILERGTNKAVGLLFAGSSTHTTANHIGDVLRALNVTLVV